MTGGKSVIVISRSPLSVGNSRTEGSLAFMFLSYIARNELTQKCSIYMIFKMPVNHYISCNPRLSLFFRQCQVFVMKTNYSLKLRQLKLTMQIFVTENHCITASSFKHM